MRGRKAYFAITYEGERYHLDGDTLQWSGGDKPMSGELIQRLDTELMQGLAPIFAHLHGDYPEIEIEQGTFKVTPQRIWVSKDGTLPDHEGWGTLNALLLSRILYPPATPEEVLIQELRTKAPSADKPVSEVTEPTDETPAPDEPNSSVPDAPPIKEAVPPPPPPSVPELSTEKEGGAAHTPPLPDPDKTTSDQEEPFGPPPPPPVTKPPVMASQPEVDTLKYPKDGPQDDTVPDGRHGIRPPSTGTAEQSIPYLPSEELPTVQEVAKYGIPVLLFLASLVVAWILRDIVPAYITAFLGFAILLIGGWREVHREVTEGRNQRIALGQQANDSSGRSGQ